MTIRMTADVVAALQKVGVASVIVETTSRTPYPKEW